MKRIVSHIFLLAFISVQLAVSAHGSIPRRYTKKLPAVDRIELQKLKPSEFEFKGVEKSKTIEGVEAQTFASLWRAQTFHQMGAFCHYPVFGIKFYFRNGTIMHASICWECNNIVVLEPNLKPNVTQGFAGESKLGRKLLAEFKRTFP
jgi:hypothetical protein